VSLSEISIHTLTLQLSIIIIIIIISTHHFPQNYHIIIIFTNTSSFFYYKKDSISLSENISADLPYGGEAPLWTRFSTFLQTILLLLLLYLPTHLLYFIVKRILYHYPRTFPKGSPHRNKHIYYYITDIVLSRRINYSSYRYIDTPSGARPVVTPLL